MVLFGIEGEVNMLDQFKKFIAQGDVLSMAVGIIMGSAFTAIVTSLVEDIFMPILVALTGAADVSGWAISIGNTEIQIGLFLQAVINFIMIAGLLFLMLKGLSKATGTDLTGTEEKEAEPAGPSEKELLAEILTELKKSNG